VKTKRIISLLLSAVMVLGLLSGCGNHQPAITDPTQGTPQSTTQNIIQSTTQPPESQPVEPSAEERIRALDVPKLWKEELRYAAALGFPMHSLEQTEITGAEVAELLDVFVMNAAPDKLEAWKDMYPVLRKNSEPISRINLLGSVFLTVQFVGGAYVDYLIGVDSVDQRIGEKAAAEWDYISQELFGGAEAVGLFDLGDFGVDFLGTACSYYNIANKCLIDGEYPVAFDTSTDTFRFKENATYLDVLMAILRPMISVNKELFATVPTEETTALLDQADTLRENILNTESDWTLGEGGTVYYVSPNGDDRNDGLTPETAWRTLDKVNSATIRDHSYLGEDKDIIANLNTKEFPAYVWAVENPDLWAEFIPGDVVLFERGGIWRGQFIGAKGVTYSAYGEGAKPEIWGSPENGSGAEKWSLLEGTDNIWVFYRELQECGGILLNGETVAIKETPLWDTETQKWLTSEYLTEFCSAPLEDCYEFDVKTLDNLHFFSALEGIDQSISFACWGKLYLRCDAGNPGEVYDSIEFFSSSDGWGQGVLAPENGVLDNLCFRYLSSGVGTRSYATVQNCVVTWVGGIVQGYYANYDEGWCTVTRCGDGIAGGYRGSKVVNNYVSYCYDFGITVESSTWACLSEDGVPSHNILVSGNLVENCCGGVGMAAWDAFDAGIDMPLFENISIDSNFVMDTGKTWSHRGDYLKSYSYLSPIVINLNPGNSDIAVTNNILYDCWDIGALVNYQYYNGDDTAADFEGNTYVIHENAKAIYFYDIKENSDKIFYDADETLAQNISDVLGDSTATIHILDRAFHAGRQ